MGAGVVDVSVCFCRVIHLHRYHAGVILMLVCLSICKDPSVPVARSILTSIHVPRWLDAGVILMCV